MPLKSNLFAGDRTLDACLTTPSAHVVPGARGDHVASIQIALQYLDDAQIAAGEIVQALYGPSTAAAVLAYKTKRNIVNRAYQTSPDNIVGQMTVAALDREMLDQQCAPRPPGPRYLCSNGRCGCQVD